MFIYLASPYTPLNGETKEQVQLRVDVVAKVGAELMQQGHSVYAAVLYSHSMSQYMSEEFRYNNEFWMKQHLGVLREASRLQVLMLPGWAESAGVQEEILFATRNKIPIDFMPVISDEQEAALSELSRMAQEDDQYFIGDGYTVEDADFGVARRKAMEAMTKPPPMVMHGGGTAIAKPDSLVARLREQAKERADKCGCPEEDYAEWQAANRIEQQAQRIDGDSLHVGLLLEENEKLKKELESWKNYGVLDLAERNANLATYLRIKWGE